MSQSYLPWSSEISLPNWVRFVERKQENKLGSNKNVFCCFLKIDCPYCLEKQFYSTLYLSGMLKFIFIHLTPFSLVVTVAGNSQTAVLRRPPIVRPYMHGLSWKSFWCLCTLPVKTDSTADLFER